MSEAIFIEKLDLETMIVPVIGTTPLIVHNFSKKARQELLERKGRGSALKEKTRNPQKEFEETLYRIENTDGSIDYGFPATGFKAATVSAARFYGKKVPMTQLRQFMFFHGILTPGDPQQLVKIDGEPRMREDVVRVSGVGKPPMIRFRAEFPEWGANLEVSYVKTSILRESVLSLIEAGGIGVGVGEWRPEKSGDFGTYSVDVDNIKIL